VTDAVSSVVREGVIAAALTGAMILLFLGSWRSTLIITLSIPLAILTALTGLSLLGETINVMTLGGLALAVGILVDDATVTIENINWHLEQGKEIEPAILDGRSRSFVPATVSLLCICTPSCRCSALVASPVICSGRSPEAVMLALAAPMLLSRTLVRRWRTISCVINTFTARLRSVTPRPAAIRLHASSTVSSMCSENVRKTYQGLLQLCLRNRIKVDRRILGFSASCRSVLRPISARTSFRLVDGGQIKLHIRAPTGTRIEETTSLTTASGPLFTASFRQANSTAS